MRVVMQAPDSESGNGYHADSEAPAELPEEVAGSGVLPAAAAPATAAAPAAPVTVRRACCRLSQPQAAPGCLRNLTGLQGCAGWILIEFLWSRCAAGQLYFPSLCKDEVLCPHKQASSM